MVGVNSISQVEQSNTNQTKNIKRTSTASRTFESYLGESESMDSIFDRAAEKYNVPVNLLKAIGKQESNFNANAVSRSGAQGVMQLMPATAQELGVKNAFNAEENIMGGAKYISGLLKKYNGDTKLALAAYNAGSGNVRKYGGIPPFKETQDYVVKVTRYMNQNLDTNVTVTTGNTSQGASQASSGAGQSNLGTVQTYTPVAVVQTPVTIEDASTNFDSIFSYSDYMRLLDLLMKEQNDTKDEEEEQKDSAYFASQQINYSAPVLNLIQSIN